MINPSLLQDSAKKIKAQTAVLTASNVPMLSQPEEVANVIIEAADSIQWSPIRLTAGRGSIKNSKETRESLYGIDDTLLEKRRIIQMLRVCLGLMIGFGMIAPASASSEDAWQAMRDKLRTGCASKAIAMGLGRIAINVDPFGSQSYGIAVLTKRGGDRKQNVSYVCVMDKKTRVFEVSGEFPLW
jgi:hypothetical protein